MSVTRASTNTLVLWLIALITLATLLLHVPSRAEFTLYAGLFVIYGLLTAFAVYFAVVLSEGELSSAHVVGMVAALSLPLSAIPVMLWSLALGGAAGSVLLALRGSATPANRSGRRSLRHTIGITARVTLSYFVATQFYAAIGGQLPLEHITWGTLPTLIAFSVAYITIYLAIFLLEIVFEGRSISRTVRGNGAEVFTALTLAVPFALLGAEVYYNRLSQMSFTIFLVGLTLAIFAQYGISRAQCQLRRQLDELKSLSVMSQVVNANLELDALLTMVYVQVSQLLDVYDFLIALYEPVERQLEYPLAMRDGQPIQPDDNPLAHSGGLIDHLLIAQEPLLIAQDVPGYARMLEVTPPSEPVYSWIGVPLLSGGRLLGAMVVTSRDPVRHFDNDELRLLNIVAASASIAIENAQLYRQQTARASQLSTLNQILSLLTGTLSPDDVLDTVILSASALADAGAVAVYLFNDERLSALSLVRSTGFSDQFPVDPPDLLLTVRPKKQSFGAQPIVVSDVNQDVRATYLREIMAREGKAAWVELPLLVGGIGLGAIGVYFDEPRTFSEEFIELMRAFANQAAQAIRNARMFAITDETLERRVGQLLALAAIGHELTATFDLRKICSLLLDHALDATNAPTGMLVLMEGEQGTPQVYAERGYPKDALDQPGILTEGATGQVLKRGEAIVIGDALADGGYVAFVPTTRSQVSVPILRGETVIGVITLESDQLNGFSEEDAYFVTQLANQAVIAIDNAYLFRRIAEARDRLQVILDTMAEAIVLVDGTGTIALANPRVDLIGLTQEQLAGKSLEDLLEQPDLDFAERTGFRSDQDVRKLLKEVKTARSWSGREPASYVATTERGMVHVQRQIKPVRDADDEIIGVLLVFYDQTEQHALAQARGDISRMIIHDLRSPLTAITTSLKLLTDIVPRESELRPMVETTTDASRRAIRKLLSRVDSLLDIARMESGQLALDVHPTELAALVDAVCVELSPLAHELNVRLLTEIPETLPALAVDPDKIERVLLNLLDNALKFSPLDSTVLICAHQPGSSDAGDHFVRIDVVDRGPGIPAEYKQTLFDRFVQLQVRAGTRRGSGLGLTFCKLAVEAHGGRIWIEDNPAGGSLFAFTLPVVSDGREGAS